MQESEKEWKNDWTSGVTPGSGVTFYFICEDALKIYRDITERGIEASEPFVGNSNWVTYVSDPDGYRLSFESHTNAEEGTKLSEVSE